MDKSGNIAGLVLSVSIHAEENVAGSLFKSENNAGTQPPFSFMKKRFDFRIFPGKEPCLIQCSVRGIVVGNDEFKIHSAARLDNLRHNNRQTFCFHIRGKNNGKFCHFSASFSGRAFRIFAWYKWRGFAVSGRGISS